MDPFDRVMDALSGNPPDIPPVAIFTQSATMGMMQACGAHWPDAHCEPALMARLGCAQADMFGFPTARVPFDITAEAIGLGCVTDGGTVDSQPSIIHRPFDADPFEGSLPGIDVLPSPDEFVRGCGPATVLEALEICSERDGLVICGGILGPVTLLSQLMGAENMVLGTLLEPGWVDDWCHALAPLQSEYAKHQHESGADVITIVEAMASSDVLDPSTYFRLSGRHMGRIAPAGARTILHICGDTAPILEAIATVPVDAFLPDPRMDPGTVIRELDGGVATVGSLDPVGILLLGTVETVIDDAWRYRDAGFSIVSPGCGLAPHTPDINLHALSHAFERRKCRTLRD